MFLERETLQARQIFVYKKLQTNKQKSSQRFAKKSWFKTWKTLLKL